MLPSLGGKIVVLNDGDLLGDSTQKKVVGSNVSLFDHSILYLLVKEYRNGGGATVVPMSKELKDFGMETRMGVMVGHPSAKLRETMPPACLRFRFRAE